MKKIVIAAILVVLIGGGLLVYYKTKTNGVQYKTIPIQNGSIRSTVTATGTVNAVKTVLVGTQVSGTLKELHVDFNSQVKKGQVIAEIDPASLQAQVDQARANTLAAKANVEKAKATLEDARKTRDRNRQLFSKDLIARSDLDTSEATHDSNSAQVNSVTAQVAQTEAALRFAETNLRYTKIVSPVDGIVVSRNVDIGQTVAASFQTPTLFTIAQDLTKMQIDTNIDEADIGKIKTGQDVEFSVDAYPDSTFRGIVEQIRIAPITVQNVVTYDVVIKVDNSDLKLKPGMTANVSVVVANKEKTLKIPNAALRFKLPETAGATVTARGPTSNKAGAGQPSGKPADKVDNTDVRATSPADNSGGRPARRTADGNGRPSGRPAGVDGRPSGRPTGVDGRQAMPKSAEGLPPTSQRAYPVWILENSKLRQVMVKTGISDGSFTEITSGDVREGQEVIVGLLSATTSKTSAPPSRGPGGFLH
jgi:HlyD family secretion protein